MLTRSEAAHHLGTVLDTNGDGRLIVFHLFWQDDDGDWHPRSESGAGECGEGEIEGVVYRYELLQHGWSVTITE